MRNRATRTPPIKYQTGQSPFLDHHIKLQQSNLLWNEPTFLSLPHWEDQTFNFEG
ncbi:uncharacterized protein MELLADRAFT_55714, partial [Melampsora larici-populina 98AG31]